MTIMRFCSVVIVLLGLFLLLVMVPASTGMRPWQIEMITLVSAAVVAVGVITWFVGDED